MTSVSALVSLLLGFLVVLQDPALAEKQETPGVILQRAFENHQAGNYSEAIRDYEKLLTFGTPPVGLLSNLGAAYAALGDVATAIRYYNQAIDLGGDSVALRLNLGLAHYKSGNIGQALPEFQRVLHTQPDNGKAALLLADCHFRLGDDASVIAALSPFSELVESDLAAAYLMGTALIREGRIEEGQRFVDVVLRNDESAEAHMLLAVGYRMANDLAAAVQEVRRAIELNPSLPGSHGLLGELLFASSGIDQIRRNPALVGQVLLPSDLDAALEAFRQELAVDPNSFEANFYYGYLLKENRQYDESIAHLRRALALRPQALQIAFHMGQARLMQGNLEEARATLEALVQQVPDLREAHGALAIIHHRLGDREKAMKHQEEVIRLTAAAQAVPPEGGSSGPP